MRQQGQPNESGQIPEEVMQELRKKTFEELSDELFLMGDGEGREDLMDVYVQLMEEKCPPDDGSFDFDAAMGEVKKKMVKEADSDPSRYDFLRRLTAEDLELLSKVGEGGNEAESLLAAVKREVMSRDQAEAAPNKAQTIPEEKIPRKARVFSSHTVGRVAAIVALTAILTVGCMMGAQAAGLNVFGNLAQWTDETFSFILPKPKQSEYYPAFREALREQGLPEELAPAWYPEEFQTDGPVYEEGNPFADSVSMFFSNGEGRFFSIFVDRYFSSEDVANWEYQKDSGDVELFTSNGRTFYIMSNLNTITAVWGEGKLVVMIEGFLSVEEMKQIIDSMGG